MIPVAEDRFDEAVKILTEATASGQVSGAVLQVRCGQTRFTQSFGDAKSVDVAFLLGSISKPIVIAALMTLYDQGRFQLEDHVGKYLPEFTGEGRDRVTIRHLLTHVSGLPDQLPENANLRQNHAPLTEFLQGTFRVPLAFEPGTRYEYSSLAILLAAEIAQRLSGIEIKEFVDEAVLQPLGMYHSALGKGHLEPSQMIPCQVEHSARESGGGAPGTQHWDWNSTYWRELGSPWGGVQASAPDVGRFLEEFLNPQGRLFKPEVARLMIRNHNPSGIAARGLGFEVGGVGDGEVGSHQTFGHTGSTGTIAWADPKRDRFCVVLTTLPAQAVPIHPCQRVLRSVWAIADEPRFHTSPAR